MSLLPGLVTKHLSASAMRQTIQAVSRSTRPNFPRRLSTDARSSELDRLCALKEKAQSESFWHKRVYVRQAEHRLQIALACSLFIVLVAIPTGWAFAKATIPKMKNHAIHLSEVAEHQAAFEKVRAEFEEHNITRETLRLHPSELDEKTLDYLLTLEDLHAGPVPESEVEAEK